MSGKIKSANAVISDSNASHTMMKGILYSPVSSLSFSMLRVSPVFIAEFHAILAMKINSVSMRYGSPRHALVMTLCIMPCTASGYSHENALSMRIGPPASSTNNSSGLEGNPSGAPPSGVLGLIASGVTGLRAYTGGVPRG